MRVVELCYMMVRQAICVLTSINYITAHYLIFILNTCSDQNNGEIASNDTLTVLASIVRFRTATFSTSGLSYIVNDVLKNREKENASEKGRKELIGDDFLVTSEFLAIF